MAREQIPSILRFARQIQSLHWLPVVWISGEFHLSGYLLHHNSCWIFFRQQMKNSVYRSRQSLNSPSPGETEMDLLVTRERPRRGIRNSGYDVSVCGQRWMQALLFPECKGDRAFCHISVYWILVEFKNTLKCFLFYYSLFPLLQSKTNWNVSE